MKPARGRPDPVRQPRFGEHVDVFEREIVGHAIGLELGGDLCESLGDARRVLGRDDALLAQHRGMCLRSAEVLPPHSLVEGNRGVYLTHHRGRAFGEAPTPHGIGAVLAPNDCASPSRNEPDRRLR